MQIICWCIIHSLSLNANGTTWRGRGIIYTTAKPNKSVHWRQSVPEVWKAPWCYMYNLIELTWGITTCSITDSFCDHMADTSDTFLILLYWHKFGEVWFLKGRIIVILYIPGMVNSGGRVAPIFFPIKNILVHHSRLGRNEETINLHIYFISWIYGHL